MAEGHFQARIGDLEVEITCSVCQEHYREPKLLPCLHYYCKQCILGLARRNGLDKPFTCPECRSESILPEGGVDELKSAFFIIRLKSMVEDLIGTDDDNTRENVSAGDVPDEVFSLTISKPPVKMVKERNGKGEESDNESAHSDDSFKSAVCELDLDSLDLTKEKGGEDGGKVAPSIKVTKDDLGFPKEDSSESAKELSSQPSKDTGDEEEGLEGKYMCKQRIEQEEAEELAKVRSLEVQDPAHPIPSGLTPPTPEVLIQVHTGDKENHTDQATGSKPYLEGISWIKGDLIGTGAFCSCYLARDVESGIMFAVKQVSFACNSEAEEAMVLSRLREEVALLGRINHPNIVRCLGATQYDRHINIFVEWMAGGCLDRLLSRFGRFSESVTCSYIRQITSGISFLHENNILHRDLKGGNILVDSTGQRIRIADFGAAARLAAHTTAPGEFQNMEGTVVFMAPEVVRGGSEDTCGYGRKCDVWSIGCVIIQMTTAKLPWLGTYERLTHFQLIYKIGQATGPPPLPKFTNPALKDFALRCLEVNPKDRPTSMELLKHPLFSHF